jgi:hypothetical protein
LGTPVAPVERAQRESDVAAIGVQPFEVADAIALLGLK